MKMELLNIVLLFLGLIFSYRKTQDVFHPYVIFCTIWVVMLFVYMLFPHNLNSLSDEFHITMFLWIINFSFFPIYTLIRSKTNTKTKTFIPVNEKEVSQNRLSLLYNISLVLVIFQLISLFLSGALMGNFYQQLINKTPDKTVMETIFDYLMKIPIVMVGYLSWNRQAVTKRRYFVLLILLLATLLLMAGKTRIFQFFFMVLFLSTESIHLKIKKLLLMLGVLLFLFIGIQQFRIQDKQRKADFEISSFMIHYTLASLPAMDYRMQNINEQSKGGSFRFFRELLSKTGIYKFEGLEFNGANEGWVFVPIGTNVYTVMNNVYCDYGNIGIVFYALFLGYFWTVIYIKARKREIVYIVFYGVILYALTMQFFDDILLSYTSDIVQYFFWTWFITSKICKHGRYSVGNV